MGYGGGYYDRFLPKAARAAKIGVAFACQIVPEVPTDRYDVQVDRITTEDELHCLRHQIIRYFCLISSFLLSSAIVPSYSILPLLMT